LPLAATHSEEFMETPFAFDNSYARLPPHFFQRVDPTPVAEPKLIEVNRALAEELGIDPDGLTAAMLAGNQLPPGAEPLAMAYAGHQFGYFVPQLGDGRAILLGEVIDRHGRRRDIQLKGSGLTAFSRRGDGRAALGPVLREYLVGEAMAAFGIPTTRALAAVTTGQQVLRETALPGAILTRVASSHLRVGTFQFFAVREDKDGIKALADYAIARHYPEMAQADRPYRAFLRAVVERQAALVARWQGIGFIHGVMNTDNCSIAGETIDFGPCAFMDSFDPNAVFSSIDEGGRYAYSNQPRIAQWNLFRLAECLLPLLAEGEEEAVAEAEMALAPYNSAFEEAYAAVMRAKLGLASAREGDLALAQDFLALMAASEADFTLAFRRLCSAAEGPEGERALRHLFADEAGIDAWLARWRDRFGQETVSVEERLAAMRRANPAIIPRNHRIEAVIRAATDRGDFAPFREMLAALADPSADRPEFALYEQPPQPEERVLQTFCGT
jgi:uncharacterized protein YdiU (UPF0061 family)